MIKLYHCVNARSFRALWALEEMQLAYELRVLSFPPRVVEPDFLAINPLGTIPALFDGATVLTESAAIIQYLAVRHGPAPIAVEPDDAAYGAWLNWLHFGEADAHFSADADPALSALSSQKTAASPRSSPTTRGGFCRGYVTSNARSRRRSIFAPGVSRAPTSPSGTRCCSPTGWAWRSIFRRWSAPIGNGCRRGRFIAPRSTNR